MTVLARPPETLAARVVLPTRRTTPLASEERGLLGEIVGEGERIFQPLAAGVDPGIWGIRGPVRFLFRRWVLQALLVLRIQGPSGFNTLARALGGIPEESLAPKMQILVAAGLVERAVLGGAPARVEYRMTRAGRLVGIGIFALTAGRARSTFGPATSDPRRCSLRTCLRGRFRRSTRSSGPRWKRPWASRTGLWEVRAA